MSDCLIFDVDGVLIDTDASFPEVIKICVKDMWSERGASGVDVRYTDSFNTILKLNGAFNDDYDIAWTMLNVFAARGSMITDDELRDIISTCASDSVAWTRENFAERFDRGAVRERCEELYFGGTGRRGIYELETPMMRAHWSELRLPAYIYTGRDLREWRCGASILGWDDMPIERVIHRDTGMTKPSSSGIDHICRSFLHSSPVMFGDSMSDKIAADSYEGCKFVGIGAMMRGECVTHYDDLTSALCDMMMMRDDMGRKA